MRNRIITFFLQIILLTAGAFAADEQKPNPPGDQPMQRPEGSCNRRHAAFNERAKQGNVDIVFFGDSITHGWDDSGKAVWEKYYGKRHAVNFGNSGDKTQNIIWRIDNGNMDGMSPKVAVVMIGTNNLNYNPEDEIIRGVQAVCQRLHAKAPEMKILLLAIFPRDEKDSKLRNAVASANKKLALLDDGKSVFFLDIGGEFIQPDGTISRDIMPDLVHLTEKGYQIWAEAIEPKISEFMGDAPVK